MTQRVALTEEQCIAAMTACNSQRKTIEYLLTKIKGADESAILQKELRALDQAYEALSTAEEAKP